MMVDGEHLLLSIRQQCSLLSIGRSNVYYQPIAKSDESLLANEIHEIAQEIPAYGYRKITAELQKRGHNINHKKVSRIMREMCIQTIYRKPKTTVHNPDHKIYPYLLRNVQIERPNQAWCTDITYIKTPNGFMYLVALMDIHSRFILSWRLSNTLDTQFCLDMLKHGLNQGKPEILNTDQGCQFTSIAWTGMVEENGIKVSIDGRGRWVDNVYIERFWRTLKHEHVLLHSYENVIELKGSVARFIEQYNFKRLHQSLGYKTPSEVYFGYKDGLVALYPANYIHQTERVVNV
jgi:putative transposase